MAGRFEVSTIFKGIDKVTAPIGRMSRSVARFTDKAERNIRRVTRSLDRFQRGIGNIGRKVLVGGAIIGATLARATMAGVNFEQTLVNAAAKFPGEITKTSDAFKALEDAAKITGKTTEFTASQSAEALNFLAMAGFNAEQSIASLNGVVDLATAGSVDLATASDIATDSLGAFNLMSKDGETLQRNLARVNDVLAKTTTTANTSMETLFETIKDGAPVATSAGASIETFAAMAGTLANAGIKGSRAGTTLKNTFLSLQAPSKQAAAVMRRIGIDAVDSEGNLRDITDIIGQLNKGLTGMGDAQRAASLEAIFGKIPIAGVNVLLNAGEEALAAYVVQLKAATGESKRMAGMMRDTTRGSLNSLMSAIEGVSITLFGMTGGPMKDAIDLTTNWVRANGDLIAQNIGEFFLSVANNIGEIISVGKKIAIVVASLWALNTVGKAVGATMAIVNAIMFLNPIGLIVLAVTALIAGFAALAYWAEDLVGWFEELNPVLRILLAPLEAIVRSIKFVKDNIGTVFDAAESLGNFLGIGGDDGPDGTTGATMSSPQERTANMIRENNTTNTSEIVIKDETGRAQLTTAKPIGLQMISSGLF